MAKLGALDEVRTAFRDGASIAALARDHNVSRGAIRTALADLLPNQPQRPQAAAGIALELLLVEVPGKVAQHLHEHGNLGEAELRVLRQGRKVRRGQGYSLHVTAPLDAHPNADTWPNVICDDRAHRTTRWVVTGPYEFGQPR